MQAATGKMTSVTQFARASSMVCVTLQDNPVSDQTPLPQILIVLVPKIRKGSGPLHRVGRIHFDSFNFKHIPISSCVCAAYNDQLVIMEGKSAVDEKQLPGWLSSEREYGLL